DKENAKEKGPAESNLLAVRGWGFISETTMNSQQTPTPYGPRNQKVRGNIPVIRASKPPVCPQAGASILGIILHLAPAVFPSSSAWLVTNGLLTGFCSPLIHNGDENCLGLIQVENMFVLL
ncbi:hypothetical protein ATANTOWER_013941, partial [Ataeniobius toweri]|nr:hypothetical protein [Ataeniobius toweri]